MDVPVPPGGPASGLAPWDPDRGELKVKCPVCQIPVLPRNLPAHIHRHATEGTICLGCLKVGDPAKIDRHWCPPVKAPNPEALRCPVCGTRGHASIVEHVHACHSEVVREKLRDHNRRVAKARQDFPLPAFRPGKRGSAEGRFRCQKCTSSFGRARDLRKHTARFHPAFDPLERKHPDKLLTCPVCLECEGTTPSSLIRRMRAKGCLSIRHCPFHGPECPIKGPIRIGPLGSYTGDCRVECGQNMLEELSAHVALVHPDEHQLVQSIAHPKFLQRRVADI